MTQVRTSLCCSVRWCVCRSNFHGTHAEGINCTAAQRWHSSTNPDAAEFAAACGRMRPEGKAPPQRLTTTQRQIMQRLVDAHGCDIEVRCFSSRLGRCKLLWRTPLAMPNDAHA